jgi:isoleucyl-tRNA synthetase
MTEETIAHVTSLVALHGSDVWWSSPVEALLPDSLKHLAPTLRKGEDTMDVWFDRYAINACMHGWMDGWMDHPLGWLVGSFIRDG